MHGIFLDVKSAFDKVWHKGLLAKLEQINISGNLLNLFQSYLTNRKQVVVVDGTLHVRLLVANCADERGQTDRQKDI